MVKQKNSRVYGQAFRPEEGVVIGRLDEDGTLVLEVDPSILPPQISRIVASFCTRDKLQETAQTSKSHELFHVDQNQ